MAFFIVFAALIVTIAVAPWVGKDSRELDPDRHEAVHPLAADAGLNVR
ncbi:hypothetical protein [Kineosporia succinea]|uniref:Uncharacterized protein n=1 Tax=Kineosporia succinea TaxID=84632 RepID=A0ABT9NZJ0_9ACTN|nr:hypothetical protein [Kineosporia succinea]MDP9825569.1 hypothetical protein [Kineosporia succinea]